MDELTITLHKEFKGYTFGLDALNTIKIKKHFPNTNQLRVVSIRNDKNDHWKKFETILLTYILPALTGLTKEQLLSIPKIFLRESLEKTYLLTFNQPSEA